MKKNILFIAILGIASLGLRGSDTGLHPESDSSNARKNQKFGFWKIRSSITNQLDVSTRKSSVNPDEKDDNETLRNNSAILPVFNRKNSVGGLNKNGSSSSLTDVLMQAGATLVVIGGVAYYCYPEKVKSAANSVVSAGGAVVRSYIVSPLAWMLGIAWMLGKVAGE